MFFKTTHWCISWWIHNTLIISRCCTVRIWRNGTIHNVFTPDMRTLNTRTRMSCATGRTMLSHICQAASTFQMFLGGVPLNSKAGFVSYTWWVWRWDTMTQLGDIPNAFQFLCAEREKWTRVSCASVFGPSIRTFSTPKYAEYSNIILNSVRQHIHFITQGNYKATCFD